MTIFRIYEDELARSNSYEIDGDDTTPEIRMWKNASCIHFDE